MAVEHTSEHRPGVFIKILGNAQDGGVPHAGCRCARCQRALDDPALRQFVTSVAIIDRRQQPARVWIIDATPDIIWQLDLLRDDLALPERPRRLRQPDGVFLTHAHMGHVGGLQQLGRESMGVSDLPVYAAKAMQELLNDSRLLSPTINRLRFQHLVHGKPVALAPDLNIEPLSVPHRDEWGVGTFAFRITGPERSALYLPDIDRWEEWEQAEDVVRSVDVAIVDACFFSANEIGGRTDVPHPFVTDTAQRFADIADRVILTHLNHSNPLLDQDSQEYSTVIEAGFRVAQTGMDVNLG